MNGYIINRLVRNGYIKEKERASYQYGMDVLILNLIPIFIILVISVVTRNIKFGVIFLLFFIPVRINIGGYHCKKISNCTLLFVLLYIFVLKLSTLSIQLILKYFGILCILFIMLLDPISYDIIENKVENYKRSKKIIKAVSILMIVILFLLNDNCLLSATSMAGILNFCLYCIGRVDLRRGKLL